MYKHFFKRLIDFLASFILFILFLPIFVIVALILTISFGGNPFFFQKRPGKNEKIFKVIKFKTMNDLKDNQGNLLPDSERITKTGSFVRKTSLDEIPQLLNVIKGDMSLVGPRPLLIKYLKYYTEKEKLRHSIRPGITGLAQINGRNNIDWDSKLALDVAYVESLNLFTDLKILFKTCYNVISSKDVTVDSYTVEPDLDELRKYLKLDK